MKTVQKYIVLLLGKFPLRWPTEAYPLKPEFDPGEISRRKRDATLFDTPGDAEKKALEHYLPDSVCVVRMTVEL